MGPRSGIQQCHILREQQTRAAGERFETASFLPAESTADDSTGCAADQVALRILHSVPILHIQLLGCLRSTTSVSFPR